ncbi:MAG: glycerol-3-phosphate dehydrogenase, partial [Rickettsiales bacterium]|nr:glycerol-3-phosphate dehydrogenase [Rickettsiales bacterium]
MDDKIYNLCIIGGGINGFGIARDAAGRGLSVFLCEKGDFASGTSSASTKLIHGGLRYLEYYDFALVYESIRERERLAQLAPHIIWPMRFILPDDQAKRDTWKVKAGLLLYDLLGGFKKQRRSSYLALNEDPTGQLVDTRFESGFSYYDCWGQDARLVVLNAMDAYARGAELHTWTECTSAVCQSGLWMITAENIVTGQAQEIKANMMVNASGPWASQVLQKTFNNNLSDNKLTLVKGSHIILNKIMPDQDTGLILQADHKRVIFVIPYEQNYTLIGTTEVFYDGDLGNLEISRDEQEYLLAQVNNYLKDKLSDADIIDSYAGVRPLYDSSNDDASAITRDYVLDLDESSGAPLLNIFGGKLTTYRKLASKSMMFITPFFNVGKDDWTAKAPLPGGDIKEASWDDFHHACRKRYEFLPEQLIWRYARNYGTLIEKLIGTAKTIEEMGTH